MAAITTEYGAATLGVTKVSALAATNVVVAFVDEFNRGRKYSPFLANGFPVQSGDALTKWLPQVLTVTQVLDSTGAATGPWKVDLPAGLQPTP